MDRGSPPWASATTSAWTACPCSWCCSPPSSGSWPSWSSWTYIQKREKEYYIWLLLLQTGMLGVFCALDFFLFYVFWEVMLVPMYFLIGIWGGPRQALRGHQVLPLHPGRARC